MSRIESRLDTGSEDFRANAAHMRGLVDDLEAKVAAARKELGWDSPPFEIPADIAAAWNARDRGIAAEASWSDAFDAYSEAHPELAAEFTRRMSGRLPHGWCKHAHAKIAEIDGEAAAMGFIVEFKKNHLLPGAQSQFA